MASLWIILRRTGIARVPASRVIISAIGIVPATRRLFVVFSFHVRGATKRGITSVAVRSVRARGMLRRCMTGRMIGPRRTA